MFRLSAEHVHLNLTKYIWSGPDPFGEYSPAMESSMNPTDQPIPDQVNVPMPQILQPETNGNAR